MKLNIKNILVFIFLFGLVLFFSSCSLTIEKRRYRPGYHVENIKQRNREFPLIADHHPVVFANNHFEPFSPTKDSIIPVNIVNPEFNEVKETKQERLNIAPVIPQNKKLFDDSCDVVYMYTGERINAIVIEIGEDYVHYKKCDDPKGRLFTVKTKYIDNITLRNGEYFIPKDRIIVDKEKEKRKSQTVFVMSIIAASIAFICFVFGFFISPFATVGFIFAVLDILYTFIIMMINIRPSRFIPSWRTRISWILLVAALIVIIAALVLILI